MISLNDAHSGIFWSALSRITIHIFQLITLIILARLLVPAEFGLITSSIVVIGFLNIFRDLGVASAIIQKSNVNDKLLSSVYWIIVTIGITMNILLFFSAPLIADFYNA
ncbi:MAG: oligosaccharide flippase family protein, partial [Ignavibacteriaceae bacterium]